MPEKKGKATKTVPETRLKKKKAILAEFCESFLRIMLYIRKFHVQDLFTGLPFYQVYINTKTL